MLCHLFQPMIERALDRDRPLPRVAHQHMARCARCAQHARQHQSIQVRLQQEALAMRSPGASMQTTQRIMAAVRRAPRATPPAARPWLAPSLRPALATAALLAIAWGVGVWSLWPAPEQALPGGAHVHGAADDLADGLAPQGGQAPVLLWTFTDAADLETLLSRDMEQELEHLRHAAQHFVDVVLSPLPEGL